MILSKVNHVRGSVTVPGDKSISHRGVILGSIAKGLTEINGFLQGADCLSTISCFTRMGIIIENRGNRVLVHGKGMRGLSRPDSDLDCGNSGTTIRLLSGILAAQGFDTTLTGDASLTKRPMNRVLAPLSLMGAQVESRGGNGLAPIHITGSSLHGIAFQSPVASAQVKSAVLLAGLYAQGETSVTEPFLSRNHSELMLKEFGADISTNDTTAFLKPAGQLYGRQITVPGDISSAAYFVAAGLLVPGSEILIRNVGINPTRAGFLAVCQKMNADITLLNEKKGPGEPSADLLVRSASLTGTVIEGGIIPSLIDELPILSVMACFAEGDTIIRDAAELRVKESDRIAVMTNYLSLMGADVTATEDGMIIRGGKKLKGAVIDSSMDHRIAMSFSIAALASQGTTQILDDSCVLISYPRFYQDLRALCG